MYVAVICNTNAWWPIHIIITAMDIILLNIPFFSYTTQHKIFPQINSSKHFT